jgi:hypothetical protein
MLPTSEAWYRGLLVAAVTPVQRTAWRLLVPSDPWAFVISSCVEATETDPLRLNHPSQPVMERQPGGPRLGRGIVGTSRSGCSSVSRGC